MIDMEAVLKSIYQGVLDGDLDKVISGVQMALDEKTSADC